MSWRNILYIILSNLLIVTISGCGDEDSDPPPPSYSYNIITQETLNDEGTISISVEISHTDEEIAFFAEESEVELNYTSENTSKGSIVVPYDTLLTMIIEYGESTFNDTLRLALNPHIENLSCNNVYLAPYVTNTVPYSEDFVFYWQNNFPLENQEVSEESYTAWHYLTMYMSSPVQNNAIPATENYYITSAISDEVVSLTFTRDLGYSLSSPLENGLAGRTSIRRVIAFRSISFPYYFIGNGL